MFDVTDSELDGIEGVTPREERRAPRGGGMPIAGGAGVGEDPQPVAPLPPSAMPVALPPPGGGGGSVALGAGKALVFVAFGMVAGGLAGGPWGAAAGVAGVGAMRNLSRVKGAFSHPDPTVRSEAGKSVTMGVFGLGLAGMLAYQAYKVKRGDAEDFS